MPYVCVANENKKWYNQIVSHDIEKIRYERIINMSRQIRTSAKAVIIQNDKLLAIKLNDGKEEWYILPGGGQDCEEMLPQTVEREVREEANQIGFDWLDLSILNRLPLFPSKLRRPIMNFYEGKEYIKYLGNEEVGDPECLE